MKKWGMGSNQEQAEHGGRGVTLPAPELGVAVGGLPRERCSSMCSRNVTALQHPPHSLGKGRAIHELPATVRA